MRMADKINASLQAASKLQQSLARHEAELAPSKSSQVIWNNITWVVDIWRVALYNKAVIKTFRDDITQKIYQRQPSRKLPHEIQQVALRKLRMLNNAGSLTDLRIPPANRLEKLSGLRAGQWSIRINDQWRICFEWQERDAYNVEIVDYH
jgi:proteic killer suppression protein